MAARKRKRGRPVRAPMKTRVKLWLARARHELRNILLAGVAVLVPISITVWIFTFVLGKMDNWIRLLPVRFRPETLLGFRIPGLEAVLFVLMVLGIGVFARNYFGRKILVFGESILEKIPFLSKVYSAAKQIIETVFRKDGMQFRKVVMIEYPRAGIWSLAFLTGRPSGEVQRKTSEDVVTVFLPTTPNPTSGFMLVVPRKDVTELDMSVESAFRMIISGGIVDGSEAERQTAAAKSAKNAKVASIKPVPRASGDA